MRVIMCVVLCLFLPAPSVLLAAEPIKIGFLYVLSGRATVFGTVAKQGSELAIEEVNKTGGVVSGRKLAGVFRDTKGDPALAVELAIRLANEDKVKCLIGIITSSEAASVVPLMKELKIPLIITTATTPGATGNYCNRYTFRVTCTTDQSLKSAALLANRSGAKKWTTVGPSYLMGYESWDLFKKYLSKENKDVEFLTEPDQVFVSMDTTDWAPCIDKLKGSGADGVLVSLWGGNVIDFLRQGREKGLFERTRTVLMPVAGSMDVFLGMRSAMPKGIWFGTPYWFTAGKGQVNDSFVNSYEAEFKSPPSYMAQTAFVGVKLYAEALRKAGTSSSPEVCKALEGLEMEAPVGPLKVRREDHQAMFDMIWGRTGDKVAFTGRGKPYRELESVIRFPPDQVLPPVTEVGCNMK